MTTEEFMDRALKLSCNSVASGGGPFGAVLVKNGEIVAEASNQVAILNDPTAHAEVLAIRTACQKLEAFSLAECELYTSCEPCPMCLGAVYWAGITKVYFAATRQEAAQAGFDDAFIYEEIIKPIGERKVAFVKVKNEGTEKAFQMWKKKGDRVEY